MRILSILLLCLATAFPALANSAQDTLATHEKWQKSAVVLRVAMQVEIERVGAPKATNWIFMERTPNGRVLLITKQSPESPQDFAFLVQDNVSMALAGEKVHAPPAAWLMGNYLFEESLEPEILMSWAFGLPGRSYSVEPEHADVGVDGELIGSISQEGWNVAYETWGRMGQVDRDTPQMFRAQKGDLSLSFVVHSVEHYAAPPVDYTEFSIR